MGLIVEEDPFTRVLFGLSRKENLTGFHLLGGRDAALPPVVTEKTTAESSSASMPKNFVAAAGI
jgi:hypothetical protein